MMDLECTSTNTKDETEVTQIKGISTGQVQMHGLDLLLSDTKKAATLSRSAFETENHPPNTYKMLDKRSQNCIYLIEDCYVWVSRAEHGIQGEGRAMQIEGIKVQSSWLSASYAERLAQWRQRIWDAIQAARTQADFYMAATMQTSQDSGHLTGLGWRALHDGLRQEAQAYFRAALHYDPYSIGAWLGLSRAATTRQQRRAFMQTAIDLQHLIRDVDRYHTH
jgi:hypothetical protein